MNLFRVLAAAVAVSSIAPAAHAWPDTPLGRTQALAVLQGLNVELLTHPSATATLDAWCASHHLAAAGKVLARSVKLDRPAGPQERAVLEVGADEPVRYRRVQLACGDKVLSEADNWYVPARLTPEMNKTLETTDTPFGRAVAALNFRRQTLSAKLLYAPLPPGWEMGARLPAQAGATLAIPPQVLQHRAVLFDQSGAPFSLVVETYTDQVLAFLPPG
jgi:chorismate-pyruvate lyase